MFLSASFGVIFRRLTKLKTIIVQTTNLSKWQPDKGKLIASILYSVELETSSSCYSYFFNNTFKISLVLNIFSSPPLAVQRAPISREMVSFYKSTKNHLVRLFLVKTCPDAQVFILFVE